MYWVYRHYNNISGKSYIGYTKKGISERWKAHIQNAFVNKTDTNMYRAMRKYPLDSWITTELWVGKQHTMAKMKEIECIESYNTYKEGYNQTRGGDGGWCVPAEKYDEWKRKQSKPGILNGMYSGYTDDEILEEMHRYFTHHNYIEVSVRSFRIYSNAKYGMPLSYSKCGNRKFRFNGIGIKEAYCEKYKVSRETLNYKRSDKHKTNLSKANKGKRWMSNNITKESKQIKPVDIGIHLNDNWEYGREYGNKNKKVG